MSDGDGENDTNDTANPALPDGARGPSVSTSTTSATASALIIAAADKAGMEGIDRHKIDHIILRESGDSAYMRQQRKRDVAVDERIKSMKDKLIMRERIGGNWRRAQEQALQPEVNRLMKTRRARSTCVVVDMDGFYISCELLSRPDLKDVPACVGSGMILTSNYCARRYGVRSAMAGWIGDKLVFELSGGKEKLIHLPANFDLYSRKSHEVRQVLSEYDPHMRAYSLDECYMDLGSYLTLRLSRGWTHDRIVAALSSKGEDTGTAAIEKKEGAPNGLDLLDSDVEDDGDGDGDREVEDLQNLPPDVVMKAAAEVVSEMRAKVTRVTGGLTCSAGLAPNFMLAKIASDRNKPNGQCIVGPSNEEILAFVRDLSVRKVPGIGRVTEKMLHAFDITTVRDLFEQRAIVSFLFKPATASFLLQASLGWSDSSDPSDEDNTETSGQKGISKERTFQPGKPWAEINSKLEDIAVKLSEAMAKKDIWAHTITLKVKLHTFDVLSRSKSMARGVYLQKASDMVPIVTTILSDLKKQHKGGSFSVRLLGIRCSNFRGDDEKADAQQPDIQSFLTKQCSKTSPNAKRKSSVGSIPKAQLPASSGQALIPITHSSHGVNRERAVSPLLGYSTPKPNSPRRDDDNVAQADHEVEQVTCPICSKSLPGANNDVLNQHIDACLNGNTVRCIARQESMAADDRAKKRRVIADFFQPES